MGRLDLYKNIMSMEEREQIEKFLILNSALVIAGVKPSATVTIKKDNENLYERWINYGIDFLKSINIDYVNLRESENSLIVLIYSKSLLENYVLKSENNDFFKRIGYESTNDINDYLIKLKDRYEEFNCPHELGVFLGIPLSDVEDFMNCTEKKCLGCGYWRIYNNYDEAIKTFNIYDEVKENAVRLIMKGDKSLEITSRLRWINFKEKISA